MLRIEKAIICGILVAAIAVFSSGFAVFADECDDIRGKVFRLHILANSDSSADQALKLKVRDKLLEASDELFTSASDKDEAIASAKNNHDEIEEIAQNEVQEEGYDYKVNASVVNMYFSTRTYGKVTLPAGNYDALRITIGKGAGHNWWCVMFPPLCLPSASGSQKLDDVLGTTEAQAITDSGNSDYVIKFKTVELFEQAKNFISSKFSKTQIKSKTK